MSSRLKILFVCPTVAAYIGGTETVVGELARRIARDADLIVLSGHRSPDQNGPSPPLLAEQGFTLRTLPFLGRDLRANRIWRRLLMCSAFKVESYSFYRSVKKSGFDLTRFDRIVTFYEADALLLWKHHPELRSRLRNLLPGVSMRRFFHHVAAQSVVFFGYRAAPRARRKWGVEIESLPLGVDELFFVDRPRLIPESKKLLYLGRLDGSKHVDWLADFFVASGLAERGYSLHIAGDGPLEDALRSKHGATAGLFMHGRKSREEIAAMLRGAALLLHPSDLESFGLTILEAMASGVPVVTHGLDSVRIWAEEVPRYATRLDAASWMQEILRFEDNAIWLAASEAGVRHARGFSWDVVAAQAWRFIERELPG